MKKFIFIVGLVLCPINVMAEEFYTNYNLIDSEVENLYEESDLLKKEEVYLYNNYYIKKTNEGYYELNNNPESSPIIDNNDYTYIKEGHYQEPVDDNTTIYNDGLIYTGRLEVFKNIKIHNVDDNTRFNNIKFYNKDKPVSYTLSGYNFEQNNKYTSPIIKISLDEAVGVEDLTIEFDLYNDASDTINFNILCTEIGFELNNLHALYSFVIKPQINNPKFIFNVIDYYTKWEPLHQSLEWLPKTGISNFSYYKKTSKLYKYYNLETVKTNMYTKEPILDYKLDKEDKITLYNYYYRDKIDIKDSLYENEPLNNLINSTSIKDKENILLSLDEESILTIKYKDEIFYKKIEVIKNELEPIKEDNEISTIKNETIKSKDDNDNEDIIKVESKKYLNLNNVPNTLNNLNDNSYKITNVPNKNIKMSSFIGMIFLILFTFILRFIYKYIQKNKG